MEALDEMTNFWLLAHQGGEELLNVLLPAEGLLVVQSFGVEN